MSRFNFLWLVAWLVSVGPSLAAGLNFAGVPLVTGAKVQANVPLSDVEKSFVREGGNAVPPYTVATIAVPPGFNPKKAWPVLIAFSSSDHQYPNWSDLMGLYSAPALAEGWVLLAGDGPTPAPRIDSSGWRAGHALAALDALHQSFPGSERWPLTCAGQSGGAKRASYLAPMFAVAGYRVAGIFLEGINQERITQGYQHFGPGKNFLRTPIFLSSGLNDPIATIAQQTAVKDSMQRTGFSNIRHVTFPGGHEVSRSHVVEALRWFRKGL
jgi:hypothetical protein